MFMFYRYQLLVDTVDNIVTQSTIMREHLGMQAKDVEMPDTDQSEFKIHNFLKPLLYSLATLCLSSHV